MVLMADHLDLMELVVLVVEAVVAVALYPLLRTCHTNTPQPLLPGATITQRGNQGGYGSNPPYFGGGGGGAGGAAAPGTSAPKGRGGVAAQVPGFQWSGDWCFCT